VWDRLLLAIDQYETGQAALGFTAGLAGATETDVRVLHVREIPKAARVPPLESPAEAETLVNDAVCDLRLAGVGAEGRFCSAPVGDVAQIIVEESMQWVCDAIVLGTRRLHGLERLSGHGTRERVLRLSHLPVIAAPTPFLSESRLPNRSRPMTIAPDDAPRLPPGASE
jgi:nucleotide-binding universal stress UspA family protein